jgi:hypothetical protein
MARSVLTIVRVAMAAALATAARVAAAPVTAARMAAAVPFLGVSPADDQRQTQQRRDCVGDVPLHDHTLRLGQLLFEAAFTNPFGFAPLTGMNRKSG